MTNLDDMKATDKSDTNPVPIDGETDIYIDPAMEKRIIRKFDMLALPQYILIIILAYLDRTNIGMPACALVNVLSLTESRRQRPHLRLRRRSRPGRKRVRQPVLSILRQLRDLRTPLGTRRAEIRSELSPRHRDRRLERRHDRYGFLPQLWAAGGLSTAARLPGSRTFPSFDLLTLDDVSAQQPGEASRSALRSDRHLRGFRWPDSIRDPAHGRKAGPRSLEVVVHHRRRNFSVSGLGRHADSPQERFQCLVLDQRRDAAHRAEAEARRSLRRRKSWLLHFIHLDGSQRCCRLGQCFEHFLRGNSSFRLRDIFANHYSRHGVRLNLLDRIIAFAVLTAAQVRVAPSQLPHNPRLHSCLHLPRSSDLVV